MKVPKDYNPEESPYFSHYRYEGNKLQKTLKIGNRTPIFHKDLPSKSVEEWVEREGKGAVVTFSEVYPEAEVRIEQPDGSIKTVTLPKWALQKEIIDPSSYYEKSAWVFRCTEIKAEAIASINWSIVREIQTEEGIEEEALEKENPIVKMIQEVNPEDNWGDFLAKISRDLDLAGKAFIQKIENKFLRRLNPKTMKVKTSPEGISHFEQHVAGGTPIRFDREEIIYLRGYDPNDDFGSISPLHAVLDSVIVEIEANKHLRDFFKNNAVPTTMVTTKNEVSDDNIKRLNGIFKSQLKGSGNQFKTIFMSEGFEPKQMGYAPSQLALEVVREEARRAICAGFGVPMSMAGASESANYATADVQRKTLYAESVLPRASYIAGVLNAELVWLLDPSVEFRFEPEKLDVMQEDKEKKATYLRGFVDSKILKPEVVAKEFGYTEEDVPEPVLNPFLMPQNRPETNVAEESQSGDVQEENPFTKSLNRYKKKAVRYMKDGLDVANCDFKSKYIPVGITEAIKARLQYSEDLGDIVRIFEEFEV